MAHDQTLHCFATADSSTPFRGSDVRICDHLGLMWFGATFCKEVNLTWSSLFDCRESRSINDLWWHGLARWFASWCKPTQSCSCIGWASWANAWTWTADEIIPCTFLLCSIDKHVMNMQHTFETPCDWLCSQTLLGACRVVTPSCQPSSNEWFD